MTPLPSHDDVLAAAARIRDRVVRTPMLRHPQLDRLTGATVLLKPEPLQRTGSFKLRGATNAILQLTDGTVVTHSSGNHGQAVACAAAAAGLSATVFMPRDAPAIKIESTQAWGARVIFYDRATDDRFKLAEDFSRDTGATLVAPFDNAEVIAGQGTAALELAFDARDAGLTMDAFLVCTGGGGLTAGSALALEGASPTTAVYAVEPEGWDDTARSLLAGSRVANPPGGSTLCDALLAAMPGELTFAVNQTRLKGGLVVSDAEVIKAMEFAFRHFKLVLEPGGAVALAALLSGRLPVADRVIGVMLSGGNVDPAVFRRCLAAPVGNEAGEH